MFPTTSDLAGLGIAPAAAAKLGCQVVAITTAGTTQGTATALTAGTLAVLTTAGSQTGALLPTGSPGDTIIVTVPTATTAVVYPNTGGTIQGGSANAGFNVAQNKTAIFIRVSALTWIVNLTA